MQFLTSLADSRVVLIGSSDPEMKVADLLPAADSIGLNHGELAANYCTCLRLTHADLDLESCSTIGQEKKGIGSRWLGCQQEPRTAAANSYRPEPEIKILGISDRFKVALKAIKAPGKSSRDEYQINLSFDPGEVVNWSREICQNLTLAPELLAAIEQAINTCSLEINSPQLQSDFTLQLLAVLEENHSKLEQQPIVCHNGEGWQLNMANSLPIGNKLAASSRELEQSLKSPPESLNKAHLLWQPEALVGASCELWQPAAWSELLKKLQQVNRLNIGAPAILQHSADLICRAFEASRCLIAFYSAADRRLLWGAIAAVGRGDRAPELKVADKSAAYPDGKAIARLIQQQPQEYPWIVEKRTDSAAKISSAAAQSAAWTWLHWEEDRENRLSLYGGTGVPALNLLLIEQWDRDRAWQVDEMELLHLALHQVHLAVEQANLYEQVDERANRVALLNRLVSQIRASLDLGQIFNTVTLELGRLLVADRCSILQYWPEKQAWQTIAEYRDQPTLAATTNLLIRERDNPLLATLHELQIVQVCDTRAPEIQVNFPFASKYPGSWLLIPIQHQEKIWGCLAFTQDMYPRYWHESELKFLETVADQLAIAIYQATLYQQTQQQNQTLSAQVEASTVELESFFDAHPDYIFAIELQDAAGLEALEGDRKLEASDLRLRFCNHAFAQGFGFTNRDAIQGKPIVECFPPLVANSFAKPNLRVFESGEILHEQETLVLADGTHYLDTFRIPIKHPNGEVYACLGTSRDITELIKTKQVVSERTEQLQDALSAARAASQAKSNFLATMSHELRTPLTAVIGMSSALLQQYLGTLNQKQSEYLHIIHNSGQHLLQLINDILDLSKIEAGKASLEIDRFCLYEVGSACLALLRERAQKHRINLIGELSSLSQKKDFYGDERRVKQILINLLSNAIKFTPAEGKVWLRMSCENNIAVIEVVDTGIGIPVEKQHLVFEPFEQLNRHYEGTGLGLALTRQLVEMHGGKIDFNSTPGKGTAFTVELPGQILDDE